MPRQTTHPSEYPQAVLQQIEKLARNIVIARKRRGESQAQWARKLGISQPTMVRIERGDPSVAMASYVMCMWLIDPAVDLASLVSPLHDHAALEDEIARVLPRHASSRRSTTLPAYPSAFGHLQAEPAQAGEAVKPLQRTGDHATPTNAGARTAAGLAALLAGPAAKPPQP